MSEQAFTDLAAALPLRWKRVRLDDDRYATAPKPPRFAGLIYESKRHKISGPPESAKTLLAYVLAFEAMRDGAKVAAVDFELGPEATRLLLTELGFTLEQIAEVHYFEPDSEPDDDQVAYFVDQHIDLVLIDSLAGAYEASSLDDNKRKEVEQWQRTWTKPLYQAGIATLLVDHVVKNAEARGDFSIGSERKAGTVDVHLGLEVVKKIARGTTGLYKAHIHKDRPAFLRAGGTREIELRSDPDTHAITWAIRETGQTSAGDHWQPTVLMEKVSAFLAAQEEPVTRNTVERGVRGKSAKYVRQAIDELVASGHVGQKHGTRGAQLVWSITPYLTASDAVAANQPLTASDCVPTASDALTPTASTASSAYGTTQSQTQSATEDAPDAVNDDWIDELYDRHADLAEDAA